LTIVHAAVLAANAHDTQPWRFRIGSDRIDVYADTDRHLGAMDPFRREMHLSLGCALENSVLVARSLGYAANLRISGGLLQEGGVLDDALPAASIGLGRQQSDASPLAAATVAATESIAADSVMIADSDRWFRATDAEIERHRDGPTLYCAGLSPLVLFGARIMPVSAQSAHRHWIDQTRDAQLGTRPVIGLIAVRDLYDRGRALRAGRLWQRLHLQGTLLGLGMQPLNQLPECVDRERQAGRSPTFSKALVDFSGDADWQPTFAFRVGWPTRPGPASPRRGLASVMMSPDRADS
jgi:hypothetical protein